MPEHWKSTVSLPSLWEKPHTNQDQPKYWCKHCSIYVKDTPVERKQHENTGKHQGNLKRFLQGIQKDHQRTERDKDRAKAEIDRLNRVTGASSSTSSQPSTNSVINKRSKPNATPLSAADQKRQWTQLAEMGIAVPQHARADMAMAGDWQTVSTREVRETVTEEDTKLNIGVRKRRLEDDDDIDGTPEIGVREAWGAATRSYPTTTDTAQDLNALLEVPVIKRQTPANEAIQQQQIESGSSDSEPIVKAEDSLDGEKQFQTSGEAPNISPDAEQKAETQPKAPAMEPEASEVPVFRKRKTKKS